jgi:hypothetical protein
MELKENDVGQDLKYGSYNLHDNSIVNSWPSIGKPSSLLNSIYILHSTEVCIVNSEPMRFDTCLFLTFFFYNLLNLKLV